MKKGITNRFIALLCVAVLAFCDVGSVLAESNNETPEEPEHTHSYVEIVTKEPTITEKGEKTFTCECGESYTEEIDMLALQNPQFEKVECITDGIALSWSSVDGATYYKVFRGKETDKYEEYAELVTVNAPQSFYTDKEVESGEIYCYIVIAYNEVNESMHTSEKVMMYLEQPVLEGELTDDGLKLSWEEVPGARYYTVERYDSNAMWERLAKVEGTSYFDDEMIYDEVYCYRIQAVYEDEECLFTGAYSEEVSACWDIIQTPTSFKVVNNGYTQLKLTWEAAPGANEYQIYRSKTNKAGSFIKVTTVKGNGTKYIDKNLTPDTKYYYKIRSYTARGGEVSPFTEVKSATPKVLTPKMNKTANATGTSVKVSWSKPAGAQGYYVYRKQGADGTWKRIATIKNSDTTSYQDTSATGRYYYAVKAYKKVDGKIYTSLRANSIQASVLGKVTMSNVEQKGTQRAVTVKWNKVSNATGYQVYKKIGKNGSWKLAKTTDKDARSYSSEIPQGTYTYWKVRAIRNINGVTTRAAYSTSKSFIFANPKFNYEVLYDNEEQIYDIGLTIENTSQGTLRFYSENASMITDGYLDSERNLYIETSAGKRLTYSEVKPGKTKTIKYKVEGDGVVCLPDTTVSFMFRYDGLKYLLLTYADASYYELYLVE